MSLIVLKVYCLEQYFKARYRLRVRSGKVLMKILLQSKNTRDYVSQGGGWTWKQGRAHEFRSGLDAIMFCLDGQVFDMQMVCVFADGGSNFTVPVTDSR